MKCSTRTGEPRFTRNDPTARGCEEVSDHSSGMGWGLES